MATWVADYREDRQGDHLEAERVEVWVRALASDEVQDRAREHIVFFP
jgi:hypothetical protein